MIITGVEADDDLCLLKARCLTSFLFFQQVFYPIYTGRPFVLSDPIGREPHQITLARTLEDVFYLRSMQQWITMPPGHGKSTTVILWMAWCFAHYPDCRFLYISYSHDLASEHTATLKSIISLTEYRSLFGVRISSESSAKDNFKTTEGGSVKAYGSQGSITGHDAGLPNLDRFSGCPVMDDMHKPDEVFSDTIRLRVNENYPQTIKTRRRGPNVPALGIGHALHEDDLRANLISGKYGEVWSNLHLACEDEANNILAPNLTSKQMVYELKNFSPYVWFSQYQGDPKPKGGGIFQTQNFFLVDKNPDCIQTFITGDTAETEEDYNDATVFSFWGVYKINDLGRKDLNVYGLHWIDCVEMRVQPSELETEFLNFYSDCCMHKTPPSFVSIERKSTGTTLVSCLNKVRGLAQKPIERSAVSKNKITRYIAIEPYINKKLVSMHRYARHTEKVLTHLSKITTNRTHVHDDIADTLYDAVHTLYIDKTLLASIVLPVNDGVDFMANMVNKEAQLRKSLWN